MKVKAIKTYPQLKEVFQKGDILELNVIRYEKDTVIVNEWQDYDHTTGMPFKRSDEVIAEKGTYKSYTITNEKGTTYSESIISGAIGHKVLSEIFEKL